LTLDSKNLMGLALAYSVNGEQKLFIYWTDILSMA
jgi:hypothetical protein